MISQGETRREIMELDILQWASSNNTWHHIGIILEIVQQPPHPESAPLIYLVLHVHCLLWVEKKPQNSQEQNPEGDSKQFESKNNTACGLANPMEGSPLRTNISCKNLKTSRLICKTIWKLVLDLPQETMGKVRERWIRILRPALEEWIETLQRPMLA